MALKLQPESSLGLPERVVLTPVSPEAHMHTEAGTIAAA